MTNAREAFASGSWSNLSMGTRKQIVKKFIDLIEARTETLALLETLDVGKPITLSVSNDVPRAIAKMRAAVSNVDKLVAPSSSDVGMFSYQQL